MEYEPIAIEVAVAIAEDVSIIMEEEEESIIFIEEESIIMDEESDIIIPPPIEPESIMPEPIIPDEPMFIEPEPMLPEPVCMDIAVSDTGVPLGADTATSLPTALSPGMGAATANAAKTAVLIRGAKKTIVEKYKGLELTRIGVVVGRLKKTLKKLLLGDAKWYLYQRG